MGNLFLKNTKYPLCSIQTFLYGILVPQNSFKEGLTRTNDIVVAKIYLSMKKKTL